jgi:hypothetical protein
MLDVADEDAEVGRCDADAIWASERAVSVKPVAIPYSATDLTMGSRVHLHFRSGVCFSVLRASSGISAQLALHRA